MINVQVCLFAAVVTMVTSMVSSTDSAPGTVIRKRATCNDQDCHEHCRKTAHFDNGRCFNNDCKCMWIALVPTPGPCNYPRGDAACDVKCKADGDLGGKCRNANCECTKRPYDINAGNRPCDGRVCMTRCMFSGRGDTGQCINDSCQCQRRVVGKRTPCNNYDCTSHCLQTSAGNTGRCHNNACACTWAALIPTFPAPTTCGIGSNHDCTVHCLQLAAGNTGICHNSACACMFVPPTFTPPIHCGIGNANQDCVIYCVSNGFQGGTCDNGHCRCIP